MQELKKAYAAYQKALKESDRLDDLWAEDPDNEEIEKKWDAAYKKETEKMWDLAAVIEKITNKEISKKKAMWIISGKPQELKNLISRIA